MHAATRNGVGAVVIVGLLASSACVPGARRDAALDRAIARDVSAIGTRQDSRVAATLDRIDGTARRLLALRSYLRAGAGVGERWTWTPAEIDAYRVSPEHRTLQEEIERVRNAFRRAWPGFDLWVNPTVRSLDEQLASWNATPSVRAASENLLLAVRQLVAAPDFPSADPARAQQAIEAFLVDYVPEPTPTVAAPGLSPHGQMRAVDFQVQQGARIVAGPHTATIATDWDAAGWTARLAAAVHESTGCFAGPLELPREPWHYTYRPECAAASAGP